MSLVRRVRVAVLGEGRDERGETGGLAPLTVIPPQQCGALHVLVRRLIFEHARPGERWAGVGADDGIDMLSPPASRHAANTLFSNEERFRGALTASLVNKERPPAQFVVAACDADKRAEFERIVARTRDAHGAHVLAALIPTPHLQVWLARKRAVERAFDREHCTVPVPDESALRVDAKSELKRLLTAAGQRFDARTQARVAAWLSGEEFSQFEAWSGWAVAREEIGRVVTAWESAQQSEQPPHEG